MLPSVLRVDAKTDRVTAETVAIARRPGRRCFMPVLNGRRVIRERKIEKWKIYRRRYYRDVRFTIRIYILYGSQ